MKQTKILQFGLLFIITTALLSSCLDDDDSYSLNNFWVGFGVIHDNPENTSGFSILMDNGEVLIPVANNNFWMKDKIENGNRVIVNFTKLGDVQSAICSHKSYYIRINDINKILLKKIHAYSAETTDSIGNDPIIFKEAWIAQDLINLKLQYWGYNKMHLINLVDSANNSDQAITLKIKHNAHSDSEEIVSTAFVSFYIDELKKEGKDSIKIKLISQDYKGIKQEKELIYRY